MKKTILALSLLVGMSSTASVFAALPQSIRIGTDATYAPFSSKDAKGDFALLTSTAIPTGSRLPPTPSTIWSSRLSLRTSKGFKRKIKREIELERVDKSKHSSQKVEFSMEQRQQLLQEFLKKNGGITRLEYSSLTGLSRLKAIDDLNIFIEKGILRKRGAGRTVFYVWQHEE